MGLSKEMQDKIYDDLNTQYEQVGFFQDQVVIVDDEKNTWDSAIKALDGNLLGQIEIVNRAIDDVKDAYNDHFTGVTSCRSDLFWMATNVSQGGGGSWDGSMTDDTQFTFECVKLNPNGYTDVVNGMEGSGNLVGVGSTYFWYLVPLGGGQGIVTTSPTNATTGAEQTPKTGNADQGGGFPYFEHHTADTFRFGFAPRNYYGLKYYSEQYALDIGDTFITSFIGTMSLGSNQLVVMNPVGTTGEDPDMGSNILRIGQIVTCEEPGVLVTTTKIAGITTGFADLSQIPTNGITTTSSPVSIITLTTASGAGVSAFDSVSFRVLDDADTGPVGQVGVVTSNGAVYKPNRFNGKDDPYVAVPSSSDQGGVGALFNVGIASAGADSPNTIEYVAVDVVGQGGLGYSPGDTVKILGDELGATTPADDIEFTVQTLVQGRFQYQIRMGDNMDLWVNPFVPQTVGIMQTADIGIGVSIALDNSGRPKGAQGWNPDLNGQEIPMDPTDYTHLTLVEPPNVGADRSYWKVGFQTAPVTGGTTLAYEGQPTGSEDADQLATLLTTLSACSSDSNTKISNAIGIVSTVETSFTDHTGNNKLMVDATNGLRSERNEICKRIWGLRQSIGQANDRITSLEGVKSFIDKPKVLKVIDND